MDAAPTTGPEELRQALKRQVASPVRWEETLLNMGTAGHDRFLEVGVGNVLSGLARRTLKGSSTTAAGTAEALADFLGATP